MELSTRFKALEKINDKFGFLSGSKINEMDMNELKIKRRQLADIYREDINKSELINERFKHHALTVD